jgi:hypothetical protein
VSEASHRRRLPPLWPELEELREVSTACLQSSPSPLTTRCRTATDERQQPVSNPSPGAPPRLG